MIKKLSNLQIKALILLIIIFAFLRSTELYFILKYHGISFKYIKYELIGFLWDIIQISPILLIAFLISNKLPTRNKISIYIGYFILLTFCCLHILIIRYFSYQLEPLDIFLFKYQFKEIKHTVKTTQINYTELALIFTFLFSIFFILNKLIKPYPLSRKSNKLALLILLFISILNFIPYIYKPLKNNKFSTNKSVYFYSQVIKSKFHSPPSNNFQITEEFQRVYDSKSYITEEYPLMHKVDDDDILGPLLHLQDKAPNIAIIIVEGLSNDFINEYKGVNLMPFLKELTSESLYWSRFFTLGERSFAIVPSILGGLPYGEKGFALLDKYPYHHTLVSILNSNNYHTSFFYGQGSWFHNKHIFFNYNSIGLIFDNTKFSDKYDKIFVDDFFWGYNDKSLFNQSFEVIDTLPNKNRLDIYFTGTSHSPFIINNEDYYNKRFELIKKASPENSTFFEAYKKYITSILFVDDALNDFFDKYSKKEEFKNTIFIITGDHPMTELPIENSLKRYHVPLIIYSPLLKAPKKFHGISSHLDLYETLLNFLGANYQIKVPKLSSSLGSILDTTLNRDKKLAFMNDNRDIVDFYSNGYFINENQLYKVNDNIELTKLENDSIKNELQNQLEVFKKVNLYVSTKNKLIPDSTYCKNLGFNLIESRHSEFSNTISTEYYHFMEKAKIPNKGCIFEISFSFKGKIKKETKVVYQLSDKNGNILFWKNAGIDNRKSSFQDRVKIPKQNNADGNELYWECILWNQPKDQIIVSEINSLLYTL